MAFFASWPPQLVFKLYVLNFNMHHIIRFYVSRAWDPSALLTRWFYSPPRILSALKNTNAVICGAAVLKYFDRDPKLLNNIDICVRLEGLRELGRVIIGQSYSFCPSIGDHKRFDTTALLQSGRGALTCGTDNPTVQKPDPYMRHFRFVRCSPLLDGSTDTVTVTVHLVRWEPLRFVLCADSSELLALTT